NPRAERWRVGFASCLSRTSPSQVPGDVDDDDALFSLEQEKQLEQLHALVVKEVLPPVADHEFGQKHGDLAVGVLLLQFQDVVHQRVDDQADVGVQSDK